MLRRAPGGAVLMQADYTHYANGLVHTVTYANGASIEYTYDDAGRVFWIDHRDINDERMVLFEYHYNERDLVTKRVEMWPTGPSIVNSFRYDDRGQLYREYRFFDPPYDYQYEYDQGGNRTRKEDLLTGDVIDYHYDYEEERFGPPNNRLMYYDTYEAGDPEPATANRCRARPVYSRD